MIKKYLKEVEKRKKIEDAYKNLLKQKPTAVIIGGPDFEV